MEKTNSMRPESGLIKVPLNYLTNSTAGGNLQILLENNTRSIYHRYSAYADYGNSLLGFGSKQPYIYDYIDEARKGLSGLRRYESRVFPMGSAPRDVIRISKFIGSGKGILFLGSQFLLQTSNAFNETRIYNPTSPIVAAGMGLTFGLVRPQRNIDITGGLLRGLIGNTIPNLFGPPKINPPSGTIGGSLPTRNLSEGKGLLRAQTANNAKSILTGRWAAGTGGEKGGFFKKIALSIFGNFISHKQVGVEVRSDEGAYALMISNGDRFNYQGNSNFFVFNQIWTAGGKVMRKNGEKNSNSSRIYNNPDGKTSSVQTWSQTNAVIGKSFIPGVGSVGIEIMESKDELHPGIKYGDSVGAHISDNLEASAILIDYSKYVYPGEEFQTKKVDKKSIDKLNETLLKVITGLKKSGVYTVTTNNESMLLPSGENDDLYTSGYNKLFKVTTSGGRSGKKSPMQYNGILAEYRDKNIRMVDNTISKDPINKSLKLPGAGNSDAINTLTVLADDNSYDPRQTRIGSLVQSVKGWNHWEPYKDDQIAFFFHDMVNEKYIPFRCAIKGVSESSTANWEELTFIGRADRLYSYGGYSRALNFSFDVLISSILELAPTWKRINYLMSLVKPANYTTSKDNYSYNKFMIPPMIALTMGDLYKSQPIMIQSVSMTVPDDAIWETMNQENSSEWSHMSDYIKSPIGKRYGQFPRNVTLTLTCALLEKERAIAGAANFGHAPHTDKYNNYDVFDYPSMHQALVEYQSNYKMPSPTDKPLTPAQVLDYKTMEPTEPFTIRRGGVGDSNFIPDTRDFSNAV